MINNLQRNNVSSTISKRDGIILQIGGRSLMVGPGSDSLVDMISVVMRVESFKLLPKVLKNPPYECQFQPDRSIELRHEDSMPGSGLIFTFDDGDDLIWMVKEATKVYRGLREFNTVPERAWVPDKALDTIS